MMIWVANKDTLVWKAFHALKQSAMEDPLALFALLPYLYKQSATPEMIRHGLGIQW